MCSVLDETDELLTRTSINGHLTEFCKKCKESKPCVLRGIDPLCRTCFLTYCTHKFRSTIGKSHKIKPGEIILVNFSGDAVSTALLHMIKQGLEETSHKRILFKPVLILIYETARNQFNAENLKTILNIMILSGLPCYISCLEKLFNEDNENLYLKFQNSEEAMDFLKSDEDLKLNELMTDIQSLTSQEDMMLYLRTILIDKIAASISCQKIFSSDCASQLAVQLLSSIALGRGNQITDFMAFADYRYNVPILRPLREFNAKEISFYNHFYHLETVILPTLSTMMPPGASIHKLTESFVTTLQEEFPSTVPTIFRTGDKVCSSLTISSERNQCSLCQSNIDTELLEGASAIGALLVSEKLTNLEECSLDQNDENCQRNCSCTNEKNYKDLDLLKHLCYACQCLIKDMKKIDSLPFSISENSKKSAIRASLKSQINEFLLPET